MKLQFIGAAQTVTGSLHYIEACGKKFILDCGLFQGHRSESELKNRNPMIDPKSLDFVLLSHAHIDHSGNIPQFSKLGFNGQVLCTSATRDLSSFMLQDSAYLQEKDAEFVSKRRAKRHEPPVKPLYTIEDTQQALSAFVGVSYRKKINLADGLDVTFFDSGHILGSSTILLEIKEKGQQSPVRLAFTGDLGRPNTPILKDPEFPGNVDFLITESTYGNRLHDSATDTDRILIDVLTRTIQRGGKIIIPAFSVGRTQEMIYHLHDLVTRKAFPQIPIFVDSPLAINATEVFRLHPECFDDEMMKRMQHDDDPLRMSDLRFIRTAEESKTLNDYHDPCIIISASGMAEGGRIRHHLANNISNPKNTILAVGYMAQNTLGRKIVDGEKVVNIFGEPHEVRAEVKVLGSFSAHADRNELLHHIDKFDRPQMKNIFLVHGEYDAQVSLADGIRGAGFKQTEIPKSGDVFTL
jgi:metallo-beta-lactamase family protein